MTTANLCISFDEESLYEKNVLAKNLADYLEAEIADVSLEIKREGQGTMDMGSIVNIVLNSAAVVAIAGGIATWIQQKNLSEVTIEINGQKLALKNVKPADRLTIIKQFLKQSVKGE